MHFTQRKCSAMAITLSSIVILLFCVPSLGTSLSFSSAATSGPVKFWKAPTVNLLHSVNWAGYAINSSAGSVVLVKGSWIQPAVTCPKSSLSAASFWVGIDGLTSPTVEQTGTLAECYQGVPAYYAWYEFYPNNSVNINSVVVHPGDVIFAHVRYLLATSKFNVMIQDLSTAKAYSYSAAVPGALRSSAEWIAEAPSSLVCNTNSYYICPLANFGTVSFGKGYTGEYGTDVARVSADTGPIGKFGIKVDGLEMVSFASATKATETPIRFSGTSFQVTWVSAGP